MKLLTSLLILSTIASMSYAADPNLIDLPYEPPAASSIFYLVIDPNSSPVAYKCAFSDIMAQIVTVGTIATGTWEGTVLALAYGGLGADVSGYSGLLAVSGGSVSEVDDKSELEAQIADVADFAEADGDTYSGAHDFSSATMTFPARQSGNTHHYRFNVWNPNAVYGDDTQICIDPNTAAAITVTKIEVTLDAAGNDINWNLKFADTFIGLANDTVIDEIDTSSGVTNITSGFDDATVPANKCIYIEFDAEPSADILQACINIDWDYD